VAEEATIDDIQTTGPSADSDSSITDGDVSRMFTDAMKSSGSSADSDSQPDTPVVDSPVDASVEPIAIDTPVDSSVAPVVPVASDPPFTQSTELLNAARDLGISVEGMKSSDDLALASLRKLHESGPLIEYAKQLLPYADQIREFFGSRGEGQQPVASEPQTQEWTPQSHFNQRWQGPEWSPQFTEAINSGMVERNPSTGLWQSAAGYEVMTGSMLEPLNAAHRHATGFWTEMSRSNPYEKFYDAMLEPMQRAWKQDMESFVSDREKQAATTNDIAQFEQQNDALLYRTNPVTGRRDPTEQGQALLGSIERINSAKTPQEVLAIALELSGMKGQQLVQQRSPQPAPVQASQPPVQPMAQQVAQQVAPVAQTNQRPQQSFLDGALRVASHSPSSGSSGDALGTAPVEMNDLDLKDFFVNQFQKQRT